MSAQSSQEFFDHWDTYHKVVAGDYMFHREIGEELKRALGARFSGRRFAFLDLAAATPPRLPRFFKTPRQAVTRVWTFPKPP